MPTRRNSRPYPFKSFRGELPSTEDVRSELENAVKYLQDGVNGITFSDINGQISSNQAVEITDTIASVVTAYQAGDEALATRITSTDAIISNPNTGLAAAHARITLETQARASLKTAFAYTTTIVQAMVGGVSASVVVEASARATADGFLEGKYTLTVTAGNVVTGMNITSSTGAGTNISSVIFRATDFLIYNSVTGVAMFTVSGTAIKLGSTLTVDTTNSKVYIGSGTFNDASTSFYVDSTGQFSLKNKLSWNGTTLSINGTVTSTSGTIGGFVLGTNTITGTSGSASLQLQLNGIVFSDTGSLAVYSASGGIDNSAPAATTIYAIRRTTDTGSRFTIDIDGLMTWGSGTGGGDTNLYRLSANNLATDDAFHAASFAGSGASITSLDAGNISSGTLSNSRLPSTISVANITVTSTLALTLGSGSPIFDTTNGSVTFRHAINGGTSRATWGTTTNHSIEVYTNNSLRWFFGSDGNFKSNGFDIRKVSSDGWTTPLNDGANTIEFQASGGQIFGRINGSGSILLG